jgi:hypothetical protein
MPRRTGAELCSFASLRLPDSALRFESINEQRRRDRSAREFPARQQQRTVIRWHSPRTLPKSFRSIQSRHWNGEVPPKSRTLRANVDVFSLDNVRSPAVIRLSEPGVAPLSRAYPRLEECRPFRTFASLRDQTRASLAHASPCIDF